MRVWLLLILVASPAAGWDQWRGDADRNEAIDPPVGVLDVVAAHPFLAGPQSLEGRFPSAFGTDLLQTLVTDETTGHCRIVGGAVGAAWEEVVALRDCAGGRLQATAGTYAVCTTGGPTDGILAAYNATGDLVWDVVPERDLGLGDAPDAPDWTWSCDGAALRDETLYAPFVATRVGADEVRHSIAAVDADGGVVWQQTVSPLGLVGDAPVSVDFDAGSTFIPYGITAVDSGVVVAGAISCPGVDLCRSPAGDRSAGSYMGALAWLSPDGALNAIEVPRPRVNADGETTPLSTAPLVSQFAAGKGSLAVAQVGGRILILDAGTSALEAEILVPLHESDAELGFWPAPLWQDHRIAVPTDRQINFLDAASYALDPTPWSTPDRTHRILDIAGDRLGRLFILTAAIDPGAQGIGSDVARFANVTVLSRDGAELHRLPLAAATRVASDPMHETGLSGTSQVAWLQAPHFVSVGGALAVFDPSGFLVHLADAPRGPAVALSDAYPAAGDEVLITIRGVGDPAYVLVRWGDGVVERHDWTGTLRLSHLYPTPGRHDLLVTLVDETGTTSTTARVVDVGGTRPPVTLVERIFAPERQDTTWGIIGLLVAVAGGLYGFYRIRRGRMRLRRALEELDGIRGVAREQPLGALGDLQSMRRHVQDRAASGYFDQAQLALLENRMAGTARTILHAAIAGFRDRLTPAYQGMLASFTEDGRITEHEAETAVAALRKERLTTQEKRHIQALLETLHA